MKPKELHKSKTVSKYISPSSSAKNKNNFTFTSQQILTNQILKVLKLRLRITGIHIPEEKLIELIKDNLSLIDIRYFKVSSLNIFVDDLIDIIKKEHEKNEEESDKNNIDKEDDICNKTTMARTTILSFNRKVYANTNNTHLIDEQSKKHKSSNIIPMKFGLDKGLNAKPFDIEFYLDGDCKNEITTLNDCDLEEIQEKIIADISKENWNDDN